MKLNNTQLQERLADPRYTDIGALPSQFKGYDWDKLYIRPFSVMDFKLISKAAQLKDMNHLIRAVDLVCTQDAAELTIGDFYYVLMWLRINSLPKSPIVMDWECEEMVLQHKTTGEIIFNDENFKQPEDISEYELVPCDTRTTESIHMSNVEIISLDEDKSVALPEGYDFPRAKHIQGLGEALADPELTMLIPSLQWAKGETLTDRFDSVLKDEVNGMEKLDMGTVLNEKFTHGLRETVVLHCNRCRVAIPYVMNLTPLTFFP